MSRVLAVLAVTGAFLAFLGTFLISGPLFLVLFPILAIVVAVLLVLEREWLAVGLGVTLAVGGVVGFLAIEAVNSERVDLSALSENLGAPFVVGLGLWVAAAALAMLWPEVVPSWVAIGAALATAVGYILLFTIPGGKFGTLSDPVATVPHALVVLLAAAPGILLLWRKPDELPPMGG